MRYRKETISHFARNNLMREGKKYKYYFFDYLYYRLYVVYRKHNEAARLSACLLLGIVSMIIFFFFSIFFNKVLTDDWFSLENFTPIQIQSIFVGVGMLCFITFFLRYTRKRTAAILLKYKGTFEIQRQHVEQDNPSMDDILFSSIGVLGRNRYM